jgi:hypothetical protein
VAVPNQPPEEILRQAALLRSCIGRKTSLQVRRPPGPAATRPPRQLHQTRRRALQPAASGQQPRAYLRRHHQAPPPVESFIHDEPRCTCRLQVKQRTRTRLPSVQGAWTPQLQDALRAGN